MKLRSTGPIALAGAALLCVSALIPAVAKGPGTPEAPITLQLLVQDGTGRQSEAAVTDLVTLAAQLTDGAITIVPTFEGGDVLHAVMTGEAQLGMVPSRDADAAGVTSLDVLETPFLIDNDALALAVATSDVAHRAMAGLDAVGVTGLAMWPEDLRHLFAFNPSGVAFRTPHDLAGADILVVAGQPGHDLITTLGGRIYSEDGPSGDLTGDRATDAEAGTLEGMVTGLWGAGLPSDDVTVAGDLALYAKYQMLVANNDALAGLSDRQRKLLDTVVAAAQGQALGRHFTEAELAVSRCQLGGTVESIGSSALGAFRAAAQPLMDQLKADPVTGELIAAVEALKNDTPVAPGAGTCDPGSVAPSPTPAPSAGAFIGDRLPPDGTYRTSSTAEELVARGALSEYAHANAGSWTWTWSAGQWTAKHDGTSEHCSGTYAIEDGVVRFVDGPGPDTGCGMRYDVRWMSDGDGIRLQLIGLGTAVSEGRMASERSVIDQVWVRVGDAPAP